jgi:DNA-binding transcriptional LysR family regulator
MRVEQLEYVAAVTRCGSFRRAAEELHLSQPALSTAVRRLEEELGVQLLERSRTGVTLAPGGEALLEDLEAAIRATERMRRTALALRGPEPGVVKLGTVTAAAAALVTPAIRALRLSHPEAEVEILAAQGDQILTDLAAGRLDLGLVNYMGGDEMPAALDSVELLRGRPVACLRADHSLAAAASVGAAEIAAQPLISMRSGYLMHRYLGILFDGAPPAASFYADGVEMGKSMVAEGLGLALLPDYSVAGDPLELQGVLKAVPVEDDAEILLVLHRRLPAPASGSPADRLHGLFVAGAGALV